jgi:hypothetical protein
MFRARRMFRLSIDPRRQRYEQLTRQIHHAETVETVNSLAKDVDDDRGFVGEDAYKDLRPLLAKQLNKLGKKKIVGHLGPLGPVGIEKEGKLI